MGDHHGLAAWPWKIMTHPQAQRGLLMREGDMKLVKLSPALSLTVLYRVNLGMPYGGVNWEDVMFGRPSDHKHGETRVRGGRLLLWWKGQEGQASPWLGISEDTTQNEHHKGSCLSPAVAPSLRARHSGVLMQSHLL